MEIPVLIYGHGIGADLRPRRLRSLLPGVGKGVLAAVFAVFVNAHSEEGNHHHGDAQVAAVAVAVLDNIGEAGHGDGHGEDNDEGGDDGAADGGGLDALEDAELFKPGHEAENSGHACGDEAEEQAGAVHGHNCGHADDLAHGEGGNGGAALHRGINALPAEKHKHGEDQSHSIHNEGYPHSLGTAVFAPHGGAAGHHGGQGHALEARIGEGVENGLGDIGKASSPEVGGQNGEDAAVAFENADNVDADGGDQDGQAHVGGGGPDDACTEDGESQYDEAHHHYADVVVQGEVIVQGGGGAGDGGGHGHEDHNVEEYLKGPLKLIKGVIEGLKKLLIGFQAPGVIHDHGLPHGQRQQQHGHNGRENAGPAQAHIVGVGLVAGGEATACVGREQHGAYGEGGYKRGLGDFGGACFHCFVPPAKMIGCLAEKQKTFRPSCPLAEETKG